MKAYNTGASVLPSNNVVMSEKERTNVIVCVFNIAMTIAGTSIGELIAPYLWLLLDIFLEVNNRLWIEAILAFPGLILVTLIWCFELKCMKQENESDGDI